MRILKISLLSFGLLASSLWSEEIVPVGAIGVGMGGAQVAIPRGSHSVLVNPAGLARKERSDVSLPISIMVGSEGDIIETADKLIDSYNTSNIGDSFDSLKGGGAGISDSAAIANIVNFLSVDAAVLNKPGQGLLAQVNAALTARWGKFGFSAGTRILGGASVNFDNTFSFVAKDGGSLIDPGVVTSASVGEATSASQSAIDIAGAASTGSGSDISAAAVQTVVTAIQTQTGVVLTEESTALLTEVVKAVNGANNGTSGTASSLEIDNDSGIEVRFLGIKEFTIAYGMSFMDGKLHVGPAIKFMQGEAASSKITLADSTSGDKDIGDELTEDTNSQSSSALGLDIGLLYDYNEKLVFGLTGRDLTSPSFDTNSGGKIKLNPALRGGVGYLYAGKPGWRGILAADLDLITTESAVLEGAESQIFALGVSQEMMGWLSIRLGLNKNLAGESSSINYSGGVGLQLYKFYVDVSATTSSDEVTIDGDNFPTRGGVGVTIGWDMNI